MAIRTASPASPASPVSPPTPAWPPEQGYWTYEDWLKLPDDGFRYEVLNGELSMAPPPAIEHQRASMSLAARMWLHATQHGLGEILEAPVGVHLPGQPVPIQPDILFVRKDRLSIIGKETIEGAPDLIVEILSPSNWPYDRKQKFQAYREAGVQEYWIADYRAKTVEVFILEAGTYSLINQHSSGETVRSTVLTGFEVKVDDVFSA